MGTWHYSASILPWEATVKSLWNGWYIMALIQSPSSYVTPQETISNRPNTEAVWKWARNFQGMCLSNWIPFRWMTGVTTHVRSPGRAQREPKWWEMRLLSSVSRNVSHCESRNALVNKDTIEYCSPRHLWEIERPWSLILCANHRILEVITPFKNLNSAGK